MTSLASSALVVERTKQIADLHRGIEASMRRSVADAIKIGELLTEQKEALPHGEFLTWIEREAPFTDRTARRYMLLFEYRSKTDTVSDLTTAYQVAQIEDQRQHPKARPQVAPEVVEQQRKRHEDFVRRIEEEEPAAAEPRIDYEAVLRRARQAQDGVRASLEREIAGDQDPEVVLREIEGLSEVHLARTKASGRHMVINEMVKFWREKSVELNRKAVAS